jgi:hypothetical protein
LTHTVNAVHAAGKPAHDFLQQEQKYQRGTQGHASRAKAIYEPNLKSDMDRCDHPEGV